MKHGNAVRCLRGQRELLGITLSVAITLSVTSLPFPYQWIDQSMDSNSYPYRCRRCAREHTAHWSYCIGCGCFGTILPAHYRPADALWPGDVVLSASELRRPSRARPLIPYDIPVSHPCFGCIYGPPGGGKSTLLSRASDSFEGPALYLALEEGIGDAVRQRLARLEIHRSDFFVATVSDVVSLDELIVQKGIGILAIDSLTVATLQPRDLLALVRDRQITVLASLQVNADGHPAGGLSVPHMADVIIKVESGHWRVEKSRFGPCTEGEVL